MYTFNHYVFGHDISSEPELSYNLWKFDIIFITTINGKKFEFSHTYHGGKTNGQPCILGIIITDDDNNNLHLDEIRSFKEEDYITDYNTFISNLKKNLLDNIIDDEEDGYEETVKEFIKFLDGTKPKLYSLEASS